MRMDLCTIIMYIWCIDGLGRRKVIEVAWCSFLVAGRSKGDRVCFRNADCIIQRLGDVHAYLTLRCGLQAVNKRINTVELSHLQDLAHEYAKRADVLG